ncbi:MAG: hypothetical protein EKK29_06205 [Hyphomicrobiales bacterium]|nr:MAG: hypothetical protein EKK29_06205 [Hyphomicrobiales bacterium]
MPSETPRSRIASAALCAALLALAPAPAGAQSRSDAPLSNLAPVAPVQDPGDDVSIPAEPAPPLRGSLEDGGPRFAASADAAPARRPKGYPAPYPAPRAPYPPPFAPKTPLPLLESYRTSYVARQNLRLRPNATPPAVTPPPTVAVTPTPKQRPKPKTEQNPFDPLGVAVGSTLLFPYVQASGGYDDNPNRLAPEFNPRPSAFFRGEGGVRVKSGWDRHSLEGELRGGYSEYVDYAEASRPDATGQAAARLDVTRDAALDLRGRMSLDTMRPGAPALASGLPSVYVVNRPVVLGVGAQAGPRQKFGRFNVSLRGLFDRVWYENGRYSDGSTLELARSSYNDFGGLLRVSYEATPDAEPFVEGTLDRRIHDAPTDFNGFYRDSKGYVLRAGADVNLTALVRGEISGGYGRRDYADPRLTPLRGPVIDAALIYTPSALTTVTLRGATSLNETTLAGASGALSRSLTATLSHDLLRNLNVTLTGDYFTNNYQGTDVQERGGGVGVRLEYKITRSVSLRGGYMHEMLDSSYPNADYTANVYSAGLRFQL